MKKKKQLRNSFGHHTVWMLLAFFVALPCAAFQQQAEDFKSYKGEVLDASSKKALVFANLAVEGTNISTVTNSEGEFLLKIPTSDTSKKLVVSFLGYKSVSLDIGTLTPNKNRILLEVSVTQLSEVDLNAPKNAANLVRETLLRKGENYFDDPTLMTAFYRETIKKRRKNVSLSEAVVNIYKSPYNSGKRDAVELYKARKSTDYSKLDTLALKLQGGPFNTLYIDVMKYPEYIFSNTLFDNYEFTFVRSTRINDQLVFVIKFEQLPNIIDPLYMGELFIDAEKKTLVSAVYSLKITDKNLAAQLFVRKKPANVKVWPTQVAYRVDYREKEGKWYYGYSNVLLEFKVNWKSKLFNSVYSMAAEMAVTDWEKNQTGALPNKTERIKKTIILSDEAIGFSDPNFWGEYNIIEPEKSIESAIRKIQRQLKRSAQRNGTAIP
ncbi:MAG: carboxypeptidase-like regulatory domain-containing protein [Bacteroidota bacterium]